MRIIVNTPSKGSLIGLTVCAAALLGGCTTGAARGPVMAAYDFGPLPAVAATSAAARPALPALIVADVTGPAWLDHQVMAYRLVYADPLQARPYATSHWSTTPLQLLSARIKSRIAQAGVKVLSVTDAAAGVTLLRIEADDFSQNFDSATQSRGQLTLRASIFQGRKLIDQKTFSHVTPAATPDAAGGVRALASATDAVASEIIGWLSALPLRKE
jgi:cholesterol transport system auxiliary component